MVAPYMGAWIEIYERRLDNLEKEVAPYMGAWIEIASRNGGSSTNMSLPTWERGLKYPR